MSEDAFLSISTSYLWAATLRNKIHGFYEWIRYDCDETTDVGCWQKALGSEKLNHIFMYNFIFNSSQLP